MSLISDPCLNQLKRLFSISCGVSVNRPRSGSVMRQFAGQVGFCRRERCCGRRGRRRTVADGRVRVAAASMAVFRWKRRRRRVVEPAIKEGVVTGVHN